jgi:hypothetical protein
MTITKDPGPRHLETELAEARALNACAEMRIRDLHSLVGKLLSQLTLMSDALTENHMMRDDHGPTPAALETELAETRALNARAEARIRDLRDFVDKLLVQLTLMSDALTRTQAPPRSREPTSAANVNLVRAGIMLADEARREEGLDRRGGEAAAPRAAGGRAPGTAAVPDRAAVGASP